MKVMTMRIEIPILAMSLLFAPLGCAQFAATGSTTVSVTIAPEAAISIGTPTTTLTSSTVFGAFTGTTNFTYKIRTTHSGGAGNIQLQVTSDFSPTNGPSVGTPPSAGDTLAYTCTVTAPATSCSGSITSSTSAATSVATFGANATSAVAGNTGSTSWTLTNDPKYKTGSYSATVTFTISAT
jgi:hypothetical protein